MNWTGLSFTDSGGFQMYKDVFLKGTNKDGVEFQSPFDGKRHFVTPEKDMEIQLAIGSDVAMCLDSMPLIEKSRKEREEAVVKTTM
jgi:queuine tRNA-ribosyltransferase